MHLAPAASCVVTRSHWHLALVLVLTVVISLLLVGLLWLPIGQASIQADGQSIPFQYLVRLAFAAVSSGLCALAWRGWYQSPRGVLRWDGQAWHWSGFTSAFGQTPLSQIGLEIGSEIRSEIRLALAFERVLLVRVQSPAGPSAWLWLHAPAQPQTSPQWLALRRAVYGAPKISAAIHQTLT